MEKTGVNAAVNDLAGSPASESGMVSEERMERRYRVLSRFSHDLRAPLNAVISFSQILLDRLSGKINDEQSQQVEIIQKSGNNLLHVIDNVIALIRIDLKTRTIPTSVVRLPELLEKLERELRGAGQGEEVDFRIHVLEGVPEEFFTNERKLLLVMNNMVRFALYACGKGDVRVEVGRIAGDSLPVFFGNTGAGSGNGGGFLKISVRHAISEHESQRLTMLFRELDEIEPADDESIRAVHLGLSLSRRIVESLGGRIWIERASGGEVISVATVPLNLEDEAEDITQDGLLTADEKEQPGGDEKTEPPASPERKSVLVVEDNPFNRNFIRVILSHMGYEVVEAENGEEGVRLALEVLPELILMDMMMPVMDGFQATRQLKSKPESQAIPILAMTALSLDKDRRRAREAGCDDFLPMPSPREVLEDKISQWIEKSKNRDA